MADINEEEQLGFETRNQIFNNNNGGFENNYNNGGFENSGSSPSVMQVEGPLGLTLSKTPSFMNLLKIRLFEDHTTQAQPNHHHAASRSQSTTTHKLKASNFPISSLSIGGKWEKTTIHQGDLTAKVYYAKRKLVWEVLERPLKRKRELVWEVLERPLKKKMEIQWSDIIAIKAIILPNQHGRLAIELNQPPTFGQEINPQPRKHTVWQNTYDFTNGHASTWRRHYVLFPPGILDKHYEQLLQCDERLLDLSRKPFPSQRDEFFVPIPSFEISQPPFSMNGYGSSRVMPPSHLPYPPPRPPISGMMHYSGLNNTEMNYQFMSQRSNEHRGINTCTDMESILMHDQPIMHLTSMLPQVNNHVSNEGSLKHEPQNYISNECLRKVEDYLLQDTTHDNTDEATAFWATNVNINNNPYYDQSQIMHDYQMVDPTVVNNSTPPDRLLDLPDHDMGILDFLFDPES